MKRQREMKGDEEEKKIIATISSGIILSDNFKYENKAKSQLLNRLYATVPHSVYMSNMCKHTQ